MPLSARKRTGRRPLEADVGPLRTHLAGESGAIGPTLHNPVTLASDADVLLGLSNQELQLDSQTANYIFAGPTTGGAADPTFRALVDADIPAAIARDSEVTAAIAAHAAIDDAHHDPVTAGNGIAVSGQQVSVDLVAAWSGLEFSDGDLRVDLDADFTWAGTHTFINAGLHILDTNASHDLIISPGSDLTADRTLTLTTGDANRTITLNGNPTLADWFDQSVKTTASPTFAGLTVNGNITVTGTVDGVDVGAHASRHELGGADAVNHDGLTGFVANEHINHTAVTLTAGNGLTGGGDISASRTFAVGAGDGIDVAADSVAVDVTDILGNGMGETSNNIYCYALRQSDDGAAALTADAAGDLTMAGSLTVANGEWIGQASGPLVTFDDSNNYLEITGCDVGIGTATPRARLTIYDSTGGGTDTDATACGGIYLDNGSVSAGDGNLGNMINFGKLGTSTYVSAAIGSVQVGSDPDRAGLVFQIHDSATATDPRIEAMRIDCTGYIGIGITTPGARLEVMESDAAVNTISDVLYLGHQTSGTAAAGFGARQVFQLENGSGTLVDAAEIVAVSTKATAGAETTLFRFTPLYSGAAGRHWALWSGAAISTSQVVIPGGSYGVTKILRYSASVAEETGAGTGSAVGALIPDSDVDLYDDGTDVLNLAVAVDGTVTIGRTSGADTFEAIIGLLWI